MFWRVGRSILLVQSQLHHIQHLQHHRDCQPCHNQDEVGSLGVRMTSACLVLKISDPSVALQENTPKLDLSIREHPTKIVNNTNSSSRIRTGTRCKEQNNYHQFHIFQCSSMPSWHLTFLQSEQNQICFFLVLLLQEGEPLL